MCTLLLRNSKNFKGDNYPALFDRKKSTVHPYSPNDFVLYLGENQLTDLQPALSAFWICVSYFFVFCVILDLGENHRADQGLPSHYPFSISLLMRKSLELDKTPTQAPIYTFDYPNASNHHSCY